jgi:hypothetical protein
MFAANGNVLASVAANMQKHYRHIEMFVCFLYVCRKFGKKCIVCRSFVTNLENKDFYHNLAKGNSYIWTCLTSKYLSVQIHNWWVCNDYKLNVAVTDEVMVFY